MIAIVIVPTAFVITGPVADAIGAASTVGVLLSRSVRDLRRVEDGVPAKTESPGPMPAAPLP